MAFRTLGAPRRTLVRGRRPKRVQPGEGGPEPVPVTQVRVIGATGFDSAADAAQWLERCRGSEPEREELVRSALRIVNVAVRAHRLAAGDPYVSEVSRAQAHRVRIGFGSGDELVDGRWQDAYTVPEPRISRRQALEPQQELAAVLSGRRAAHASEDLALRARMDLDHDRVAQAALQLEAALAALETELQSETGGGKGLPELARRRPRARELAAAALRGPLEQIQEEELREIQTQLERALRRRRHSYAGG